MKLWLVSRREGHELILCDIWDSEKGAKDSAEVWNDLLKKREVLGGFAVFVDGPYRLNWFDECSEIGW